MKYWKNSKQYTAPDPTPEELTQYELERKQFEEQLKNTPPSEGERLEAIETAILEIAEVLFNG